MPLRRATAKVRPRTRALAPDTTTTRTGGTGETAGGRTTKEAMVGDRAARRTVRRRALSRLSRSPVAGAHRGRNAQHHHSGLRCRSRPRHQAHPAEASATIWSIWSWPIVPTGPSRAETISRAPGSKSSVCAADHVGIGRSRVAAVDAAVHDRPRCGPDHEKRPLSLSRLILLDLEKTTVTRLCCISKKHFERSCLLARKESARVPLLRPVLFRW